MVVNAKLFTSVWMQKAAEYKALCIQAYNIARLRLDQYNKLSLDRKPNAIITDIDETFLDNSPNSIHQALLGKDFEESSWDQWVNRASADTISGSLEFFQYAASKNVAIFYVTNRTENGRKATIENLKRFHFPFADDAHLIMKTNTSSKEYRRESIKKDYNVILYLGDNLGDFSAIFDKKSQEERTANVFANASNFGDHFIIIPNPNYGDWESALYQYKYNWNSLQKDSIFKSNAKNY